AAQPQLYLEVDRAKAKALGVALDDVFATLQIYLGSAYANDFTRFGRNWQVNLQADAAYRVNPDDIGQLKVRNRNGGMVPLSTLVSVRDTTGPAAKNAILIVEFAKQLQDEGKPRFEAIVEASKTRLRPILMTSFAFILGVLPLVRTAGAGAEMRFALGIAVFSGMVGVTVFGIFFTPVFYEVIRGWTDRRPTRRPAPAAPVGHEPEPHTPRAAVS